MPAPAIHGRLCRDSPVAGFLMTMRRFGRKKPYVGPQRPTRL
jgi:hypothetical protein